ncbi:MAG: hypothetical protein ACLU3G_06005 [Christensenellales bacterium]
MDEKNESRMTRVIANALFGYFDTLYSLNRNLIMLCGLDVVENSGQYEKVAEYVIINAPRLIPYKYDPKKEKDIIEKNDGLLEFKKELPFLYDEYCAILQNNYKFLDDLKKIRNKLEHKMHGARHTGGCSGTNSLVYLTFQLKDDEIKLYAGDFIKFTKEVNSLFSKLQELVREYAITEDKEFHVYYQRLTRYDFCKFNKIYDSDLLQDFGQALFPF